MIRILLAGEGPNDLGGWYRPLDAPIETFRGSESRTLGVIEALLGKVRPGGWEIREAIVWRDIPKLQVNHPDQGESANVLRLLHRARERGCHAVVFVRDRDGEKRRQRDIERTIKRAPKVLKVVPAIIGGLAVERLEAWLLALRGTEKTEEMREPEALLQTQGVPPKQTTAMAQIALNAKLSRIPADALSLRRWLRRAAHGLHVRVPKKWP